jgi:uncharacterized phage-associated protein
MKKHESLQPATSSIEVAHRIILESYNADAGETISNLKLQKMLYYMQGFFIAVFDKKLFDEPILAWNYGPVVYNAYNHFSKFKKQAIVLKGKPKKTRLEGKELALFNEVMSVYGQYSAIKLMNMTHEELPWKKTFNEGPGNEIPYELLRSYFKTKIK